MMVTASLAEVRGLSLRDVYECEDENFLLYAAAVVTKTVEAREAINRELRRKR